MLRFSGSSQNAGTYIYIYIYIHTHIIYTSGGHRLIVLI